MAHVMDRCVYILWEEVLHLFCLSSSFFVFRNTPPPPHPLSLIHFSLVHNFDSTLLPPDFLCPFSHLFLSYVFHIFLTKSHFNPKFRLPDCFASCVFSCINCKCFSLWWIDISCPREGVYTTFSASSLALCCPSHHMIYEIVLFHVRIRC